MNLHSAIFQNPLNLTIFLLNCLQETCPCRPGSQVSSSFQAHSRTEGSAGLPSPTRLPRPPIPHTSPQASHYPPYASPHCPRPHRGGAAVTNAPTSTSPSSECTARTLTLWVLTNGGHAPTITASQGHLTCLRRKKGDVEGARGEPQADRRSVGCGQARPARNLRRKGWIRCSHP